MTKQEKYHNWLLLSVLTAIVLLSWVAALLFIGAAQSDTRIELATVQKQADDLRTHLQHAGMTIQQLDQELNNKEFLPTGMAAEYAGEFDCTAYDANCEICQTTNITATGTLPVPGVTAAADWDILPPGTVIYIEDVGIRVIEDRGGLVQGNKLDVLVEDHATAASWAGWGSHKVWILKEKLK